jgi:hypothetical protein
MDCQSGCPLKSVSFAYFPAADPGSGCPAQGSALMWALMWLVWPRANRPREPEAKDMDCVDSRVKFKNRAGESPATTQTAC